MANLSQQFIDLIIRGKDLFSSESSKTEKALNELRSATKETKDELSQLEDTQRTLAKHDALKPVLEQQKQAMDTAAAAVQAYAKKMDGMKKPTQEVRVEFADLKRTAAATAREFNKTQTQLDKQAIALEQAGVNTADLATEQKRLEQATADVTAKLNQAKQATLDYAKAASADEKLKKQAQTARQAVTAYEEYAASLAKSERPTQAQIERLHQLNQKAQASVNVFKGASISLGDHIIKMDRAGQETGELLEKQRKLHDETAKLANRFKTASTSADKITTNMHSMGDVAEKTTGKLNGMVGSLLAIGGAYVGIDTITRALGKFFRTAGQMEDFRYQLIGVYDDIEKGGKAFDWVVDFAKTVPPSLEDVLQSFIMLHNQGMTPMDGTLEKLIAANSKYGKGNATLVPIIRQLTQAWAKNRIQAEEVYVLIENGIPVWNMLEEATGKSVGQLQKMAEQGKLTRHELKKLIEIMGANSINAMNLRMESFNSLLSKMGDRINQILDTIARSGALKYFKDELDALGDSIDAMGKNGELQKMAKEVSEGMIATASAMKSAVVFTYEWAGAIKVAAVALISLKAVSIFRAITAELGPLIVKTKAWGAYSLGVLPKIRLGYLALGAGIGFAANQFYELAKAAYQWYEAEKQLEASQNLQFETFKALSSTLQKYSRELGVTMNTMDDYRRLIKEGVIVHDELTGELITAAEHQKRLNERMKEGTKEVFPLREAIQELVASFSSMADRGDSVEQIFKSIFQSFDPTHVGQMLDFAESLHQVEQQGILTAEQIEKGLVAALTQLSGEDLQKFQYAAQLMFKAVEDSATSTSDALTAALSGALAKLGLDIQVVRNEWTTLGEDAVHTLEAIAQNAEQTNVSIYAATNAAIKLGATSTDLEKLADKVRDLGSRGKLTGQQVSDALLAISGRMNELEREASRTEQALARLNVVSLSGLNDQLRQTAEDYRSVVAAQKAGEASSYQVKQAYLAWAQAAIQVAQANDKQVPGIVAVHAASLGLNDELAKLVQSYSGAAGNGKVFEQSLESIEQKATATKYALEAFASSTRQTSQTTRDSAQAADEAAKSQENLAGGMQASGGMSDVLNAHLTALSDKMRQLSEATYQYFSQLLESRIDVQTQRTAEFADELEGLRAEMVELSRTALIGSEVGKWIAQTSLAAAQAEHAYKSQARALEKLQAKLSDTSNLTQNLIDKAKGSMGAFGLLDDSKLSGLQSAIAAAEAKLKSMTESAKSALQSIEQELLSMNGSLVEQEQARLAAKRQELEAKLAEAKAAGNKEAIAELNKAISLFQKLERQKLDEARQAQAEQQRQEREAARAEAKERQDARKEAAEQAKQEREQQAEERQQQADKLADERSKQGKTSASSNQSAPANQAEPVNQPQPQPQPQQPTLNVVDVVRFEINIGGRKSVAFTEPVQQQDLINSLMDLKNISM